MMNPQKILTMQDLSCVGQCSLTVALPILSSYGIETAVLPTAVLSNHTMFPSWSYLDLTPEIDSIFQHWEKSNISFDAFLLGYLGKKKLIDIAINCFQKFSKKNAKIFLDPVFADNGKLYSGFTLDYVYEMRRLLNYADVLLPNVTEACFLTGVEYQKNQDEAFIEKIGKELRKYTKATIVLTGVQKENKIGEWIDQNGESMYLWHELIPATRHGTGDIFSSVFTANFLKGLEVKECSNRAASFVADCLKITGEDHFYGVYFESILDKQRRK